MQIGITGGTGFLGRYIIAQLATEGYHLRCWCRPSSDRTGFGDYMDRITWVEGDLGDAKSAARLVEGCDAVVHAALARGGGSFQGRPGDLVDYVRTNLLGTLMLVEAARAAQASRFIFISTCAVHDVILDNRPLDETHVLWPKSHYGAHKAAIEKFVHSLGLGDGYDICALRPTGIYGLAHPPARSRWYDLVKAVARGETVECNGGGKEVHAADVAKAVSLLLTAGGVAGQAYNCTDQYISQWDVAHAARELAGSKAEIKGEQSRPKHEIDTTKLRALGMVFSGDDLLRATVQQILEA
jgi:nucleoside-diphosphate-sugar epimerase